ncbi:class I SAM-dependent methyltransferase [Candidatus Woesearchaeota archaeon]|nr:class I SAM-dependent methyltransferase [Candidatus Woesearchaeota archaeon]
MKYFETRYSQDPRRTVVWKQITSYLSRWITPDATVLELGGGYCDFINNVKAKEKHVVDITPNVKKYAATDVHAHVADVRTFTLNQKFDIVFASNLLEHFTDEDLEKIMKNVSHLLKPGGQLILLQPNYRYATKEYFDDYTHKKIFSHISLCDFLATQEFTVKTCKPKFLPLSFKSSKLPAPGWLVWLYLHSPLKPFAKQMLVVAINEKNN